METIRWRHNLFWLWLTQTLSMMGLSGIMPFIPIYIRDVFGIADEGMRGFCVSLFTFAGLAGLTVSAPIWGMLGDRYGRKLMLLRAYCGLGVTLPLLLAAPNIGVLIALRLFSSLFAGTVNAAQALAVTTTPERHHGLALGMLTSAMWGGNMVGYFVGGVVVEKLGYVWTFAGCGALMLTAALLTVCFIRESFVPPSPADRKRQGGRHVWNAAVWLLLASVFLLAVARRTDGPYLAMLVEVVNGTTRKAAYYTGIISGAAALGGILAGAVVGWLCDRFSPFKVAVPLLLAAWAAAMTQAAAGNLGVLAAARFSLFFAAGGLEPALMSRLAQEVPPERRGTVFGLCTSLRTGGVLAATVLSGALFFWIGTRGVFLLGGMLFPLIVPLMFRLGRRRS